ncbi:pyrroline-5-carboxylate reductase [Aulographum hederae CBS 113979]|uniref:Pyrroline-5-carboxylate reductase n=1 Tax=Aulographum hederae CBS 113979 TaxID=1176131 RepID=A0A6G1HD31_9PEZI|nr:pyrroline-5-carboxylate reductase [Aulographum hederae CBS 113979]
MAQSNTNQGLTLTVLGCGTMGIAILSGIMASLADLNQGLPTSQNPTPSGTSTPQEESPQRLPSRFIACVRRPESAKKIKSALSTYSSASLETLVGDNLKGVQEADVVLLGCKPQMFREILSAPGIKEALKGKLLISILAGVTTESIEQHLYPSSSTTSTSDTSTPCRIVRAMPNTASFVRESMTVIAHSTPPLPPASATLTNWIFTRIGRVVHLPPSSMDAATALCGSGPAFMALVLEAIADGAVAMGLPRAEAQMMAAQTMRGTTGLVLAGEHPAILRDKVSTPGGCTIGGLLVLEEGRVRGTVARAVREATVVAGQLGKGVVGVNGTRF